MSPDIQTWISSSLARHFPSTPAPARPAMPRMEVARNESFSFQAVFRRELSPAGEPLGEPVPVSVRVEAPPGWKVRVRRVGFVPVRHRNLLARREESDGFDLIPGFVPDPLLEEREILLPPGETHAFWISVHPSRRGFSAGTHPLEITCHRGNRPPRRHRIRVEVADIFLAPLKNFRVTNWFYADALLDYYRLEGFDERFWQILERYLRNLAQHGQNTIYLPLLTPPLDGVKRPTQLLRVSRRGDSYQFGWDDVRRFARTARRAGLRYFEWPHLFTQWGCDRAIRVYRGQGEEEIPMWPDDQGAVSPVYRRFLQALLPRLHRFLEEEGLLSRSYFHLSDEPGPDHLDNYRAARGMVREIAPWMKVMDALSNIDFAREGLTDTPVAAINHIEPFLEEQRPCWAYYCCSQRGPWLNRLLDTPLPKIRMNGWLFHRWPVGGFLHWGANYWHRRQSRELIDPFATQDAHAWPNWPFGDPFVLYPGPDGPIDSIRWEVFAESLQDMRLLQTAGIKREDSLLRPLRSFADFPKSADWIRRTRRAIFRRAC